MEVYGAHIDKYTLQTLRAALRNSGRIATAKFNPI
jgi:hypothetical protein